MVRTSVASPVDRGSTTKIRQLADELKGIILALPEGAAIGKELELCNRLGCTRPILRQVSRHLEFQGLLYVRRGPMGGYFGARPAIESVIDIVTTYFAARGVTLDQSIKAVMCSLVEVARLAARCREDSPAYARMKNLHDELSGRYPEDMGSAEFSSDECKIDEAIFGMIEIEPLEVFVTILNRLCVGEFEHELFSRRPERRIQFRAIRMKTIVAILEHDEDAAAGYMTQVHDLMQEWLPSSARSAGVAAPKPSVVAV